MPSKNPCLLDKNNNRHTSGKVALWAQTFPSCPRMAAEARAWPGESSYSKWSSTYACHDMVAVPRPPNPKPCKGAFDRLELPTIIEQRRDRTNLLSTINTLWTRNVTTTGSILCLEAFPVRSSSVYHTTKGMWCKPQKWTAEGEERRCYLWRLLGFKAHIAVQGDRCLRRWHICNFGRVHWETLPKVGSWFGTSKAPDIFGSCLHFHQCRFSIFALWFTCFFFGSILTCLDLSTVILIFLAPQIEHLLNHETPI